MTSSDSIASATIDSEKLSDAFELMRQAISIEPLVDTTRDRRLALILVEIFNENSRATAEELASNGISRYLVLYGAGMTVH